MKIIENMLVTFVMQAAIFAAVAMFLVVFIEILSI